MIVYLLDRYARNASDKTELDRLVEQRLRNTPNSRALASRLVSNFQSIPIERRKAVFGQYANVTATERISAEQIKATVSKALQQLGPNLLPKQFPEPVESPVPPSPGKKTRSEKVGSVKVNLPGAVQRTYRSSWETTPILMRREPAFEMPIQLRYMGLSCREETDWDQSSDSDEIYLITSVINVGTGEHQERNHPYDYRPPYYEDVDSREARPGPIISCWNGEPTDLVLVATLMEQDFGDPNHFREELHLIVDIALTIAGYAIGGPIIGAISGALGALLVEAINGLLDTDDDLISNENYFISSSDLTRLGHSPLMGRRVQYHFYTQHRGEGANYFAYFSVYDPNPLAVSPAGAASAPAPRLLPDLVVTSVEVVGPPVVRGESTEVPIKAVITNQGYGTAGVFKVDVEYSAGAALPHHVPFAVPGQRDMEYPYTSASLPPRASVTFTGKAVIRSSDRMDTASLRIFADSCGGEEFSPDYCHVRETVETNNWSRAVRLVTPR